MPPGADTSGVRGLIGNPVSVGVLVRIVHLWILTLRIDPHPADLAVRLNHESKHKRLIHV